MIRALRQAVSERFFAPAGNHFATLVETLVLPVLAIMLGAWFSPDDPLLVRAQFPWLWLAPLLLALRYGPMAGLGGALVLFAGWYGLEHHTLAERGLPKLNFLGGLILTMLAGEFASTWQARVRRAEATQDYLDRRLDSLTRTHYLLRLSHESLEQDLLSRPVSMRDALTGLRELVASIGAAGEALPAADKLLKLAVQFCQIERAALVPVQGELPVAASAVFLGAGFELDERDALIQHALQMRLLAHVASESAESRPDSRYLIVAPLVDSTGHLHALLVVENLPFLALQEETLQVLNLMLGYYADSLAAAPLVAPLHAVRADCPSIFALELQRLHRLSRESGVPSALVALVFTGRTEQDDLPLRLQRQQRSLDVTWLLGLGDHCVLLAILPLAPEAAVEGYLARSERWLNQHYGLSLETAGIRSRLWHIGEQLPVILLARVLENCHVAIQADPLLPAV